jgi:transketolase C-terminal domain/subunit
MIKTNKKIGDKVKIWDSSFRYYGNSKNICSVEYQELNGTIIRIHVDVSKTDYDISYDILTDKGIFTRIDNTTILVDKRDRHFYKANKKIINNENKKRRKFI